MVWHRALALAAKGMGHVSPNPMVGCVIVYQDKIIGEGYHHQYGGPHAEVVAVRSVREQSLLSESDVYVTLEPCAHHGKTPPCADLLIQHRAKRVIIAQQDPNPLVNGGGIRKMKEAGIEVITGVLEKEATFLNRRFNTFFGQKRPYIVLKWAQTADGFIARQNFDSKWISGTQSRQLVHRWRAEEDAILVGKNTALHDNPQLNVRDWSGKSPVRVVVDHHQLLPGGLHLFDGAIPTYRYHTAGMVEHEHEIKLSPENFEQLVLEDLHNKKIQSLIIEGGACTLKRFVDLDLWDEARVFVSEQKFVEGIRAPRLHQEADRVETLEKDMIYFYENSKT